MFNKDFYPTPRPLADKLLQGLDFAMIRTILEPSAGKGDLVKHLEETAEIRSYRHKSTIDIDCIEIDKNLQHILKGEKYRVVHNNFLTYQTYKRYDLIIANFPYSEGDKHLLKAISMQEVYGGKIRCLVNAETIRNAYTNVRNKLLVKLRKYGAEIEYLKDEFKQAERKSDVEIALVKIDIPAPERPSLLLEGLREDMSKREPEEYECRDLISSDFIDGIIAQYNFEVEAGIRLIDEYLKFRPMMLDSLKEKAYSDPIIKMEVKGTDKGGMVNAYIAKVRYKYWSALFDNPEFVGKLTSNLRTDLHGRVEELQNYDFSHYNIYTIRLEMQNSMVKGVEDTILTLFEDLSHKYAYGDGKNNKLHYDGWKTNVAYKINSKKVILPCYGAIGVNSWDNGELDLSWSNIQILDDIQKVLNYLDCGNTTGPMAAETLEKYKRTHTTKNIEAKFFTMDFYKKGTVHLKWNCPELIEKFNIYGSQRKGWLPPSYGKESYDDMDEEERKVIDDFQGKESYEKVLREKDYYIAEPKSFLQIESSVA